MARNHRTRFAANSLVDENSTIIASSAGDTGFENTNALNTTRHSIWQDSGVVAGEQSFFIDEYNNLLYVDSVEYAFTPGNYTLAELDTEIKTFNAGWGINQFGGSSLLRITLDVSSTFNFTTTTKTIWSTLGMDYVADFVGTSVIGVVPIHHGKMVIELDLGFDQQIGLIALLGKSDEAFPFTSSATITIMASPVTGIDSWSNPAFSKVVTPGDGGVFEFIDDDAGFMNYRYVRIEIEDRSNPDPVYLSNIYIGDYVTPLCTNLSNGFSKIINDLSTKATSENGVRFYSSKSKNFEYTSMTMLYLTITEREEIEQLFFDIGVGNAFYISLDPLVQVSSSVSDTTKFVNFSSAPRLSHVYADRYSLEFAVEEVI